MKKKIALIAGFGWGGISVPLATTIEYLSSKGFVVDVYLEKDEFCDKLGLNQPLFEHDKSTVYFYKYAGVDGSEKFGYRELIVSRKNYFFFNYIQDKSAGYDALIGFDPDGLVRAGITGEELGVPYYYFSLEFYEKQDDLKIAESYFSKRAVRVLTQDKYRARILSKLLNIETTKISVVYNSTIGEILNAKSNFIREKFNIENSKRVVLASGTLLKITGVDIILDSLQQWSDDYVLVLHGWSADKNIIKLIEDARHQYSGKVFFSDKPLPHKDKFKVFSSVDIGLMFYKPVNLNLKYASWSSGKFFDFARCGVPVIAYDIPNMKQLVADNHCGLVLDNFNRLPEAFSEIIENYEYYSSGCYHAYEKYSFETSFQNSVKDILL